MTFPTPDEKFANVAIMCVSLLANGKVDQAISFSPKLPTIPIEPVPAEPPVVPDTTRKIS